MSQEHFVMSLILVTLSESAAPYVVSYIKSQPKTLKFKTGRVVGHVNGHVVGHVLRYRIFVDRWMLLHNMQQRYKHIDNTLLVS